MVLLVVIGMIAFAVFIFLGHLVDFRFDFRRGGAKRRGGPSGGATSLGLSMKREYLKGCGPFEFGEGDRAVLVLHGIAGSPAQLRGMCRRLAADRVRGKINEAEPKAFTRGLHLYGVVLAGHGTSPEDLFGITWQKWFSSCLSEFDRLKELHGSVSVIGFSLGAALAIRLASERPVDRLVLISSPMYFFHDYLPMHHLLKVARLFASTAKAFPERFPEGRDGPEYMIYRRIPLEALDAVVELAKGNGDLLYKVTSPVLMVHSKRDVSSRPRSAWEIYERLGSQDKRLVWLDNSPHGLMHGPEADRGILHEEIKSFLLR